MKQGKHGRMKYKRILAGTLPAILAFACIAQAATIVTVDDKTFSGDVAELNNTRLALATDNGVAAFDTDSVLSIDIRPVAARTNVRHALKLRNGDLIFGTITGGSEDTINIDAPVFGKLTFPLSEVHTAWFDTGEKDEHIAHAPAETEERDRIILRNGDSLPGLVMEMSKEEVAFDCALGKVPIPVARIRSLSFAPLGEPYREPSSMLFEIRFTDGSTLTAGAAELREDTLHASSTLKHEFKTPFVRVAQIRIRNGRLIYLSDIEPVEAKQIPMFDEHPWQYRRDRSVNGSAISLGGREFEKGLGTHSRCELTYELGGAFKTFASTVGINDDATGGNAEIRILLDGKQILPHDGQPLHVVSGAEPVDIELDVSGGQKLTLIIDFGENLHINDRVSWGNARVLK